MENRRLKNDGDGVGEEEEEEISWEPSEVEGDIEGGTAPVLASERQGTGNDFGSFWESYEMKNEWRRGKFRKAFQNDDSPFIIYR